MSVNETKLFRPDQLSYPPASSVVMTLLTYTLKFKEL